MNQPYSMRPRRQGSTPDVIFILLVLNILAYAGQFLIDFRTWAGFMLWPIGTDPSFFRPWQLVTYAFLHDTNGIGHLFFNMFGLWMFGRDIEWSMGTRRFLVYYFTCVVGAGIVQLIFTAVMGLPQPTLGASGGVFGILLAYGIAFPNRTVMLLIPPIPMKAKYFVLVYGLLTLFMGVAGTASGVAHFAHLGGMLFGFGLIMYWRNAPRRR